MNFFRQPFRRILAQVVLGMVILLAGKALGEQAEAKADGTLWLVTVAFALVVGMVLLETPEDPRGAA